MKNSAVVGHDFMPNIILQAVKQAIAKSERKPHILKFECLAKSQTQGASLLIGGTWLCLGSDARLTYQWEHNGSRGAGGDSVVQLPSFEDPKFDPQAIVDFALRLWNSKVATYDFVHKSKEEISQAFNELGTPLEGPVWELKVVLSKR